MVGVAVLRHRYRQLRAAAASGNPRARFVGGQISGNPAAEENPVLLFLRALRREGKAHALLHPAIRDRALRRVADNPAAVKGGCGPRAGHREAHPADTAGNLRAVRRARNTAGQNHINRPVI